METSVDEEPTQCHKSEGGDVFATGMKAMNRQCNREGGGMFRFLARLVTSRRSK